MRLSSTTKRWGSADDEAYSLSTIGSDAIYRIRLSDRLSDQKQLSISEFCIS